MRSANGDDVESGGGDTARPATPTWSRVLIFTAGTLAVLLVGATLGMLITKSSSDAPAADPAPGPVEIGFAQDMSVHHLQAVTMANWARGHSTAPEIQQLAFDIGTTQLEQVGRMKGWLMLWNKPELPTGDYMTWMQGSGGHAHGGKQATDTSGDAPMPGMATTDELERLRSLAGKELDIYFLQLMLRHHQGGTDMARYAERHSSVRAIDTLAGSMLKVQGAEMDLMRQLLAERGAQPLPFP